MAEQSHEVRVPPGGPPDEPVVLHEAAGVVVLAKPSGLATQAPPGIPSVESWLRARLSPDATRYLGVPHRLDRAVSGVMLMATTPRAARQLSRQFERRQVRKTYLAVAVPAADAALPPQVGGVPAVWRDVIAKVPDQPRAVIVGPDDRAGREAVTEATLLAAAATRDRVLLRLEPLTGRMHQLRVQAAIRGLPILGDALYGGPANGAMTMADPRLAPIALHAWSIAYTDPDSRREIVVEAPLPPHWPADPRLP